MPVSCGHTLALRCGSCWDKPRFPLRKASWGGGRGAVFETSGFKSLCTFLMVSRHTVHFLRPGEASLRVIGANPAVTGDRERQSPQQGSPWPQLGFSTAGDGAAPHTQPCCGQQASQQDPACVRQKLQEQYRPRAGRKRPICSFCSPTSVPSSSRCRQTLQTPDENCFQMPLLKKPSSKSGACTRPRSGRFLPRAKCALAVSPLPGPVLLSVCP